MEENASNNFKNKPRLMLSEQAVRFNGLQINQSDNMVISLVHDENIDKLQMPVGQKEFASHRALAQYVGVNIRPDICAPVQLLAPGSEPTTKEEFKLFSNVVSFLKETKETHLRFIRLDLQLVKLFLTSEASFENSKGLKSQLGYVISLVDKIGQANIVHYSSNRCRRVVRSVMAVEVQGLV